MTSVGFERLLEHADDVGLGQELLIADCGLLIECRLRIARALQVTDAIDFRAPVFLSGLTVSVVLVLTW